jgi:hypothetical protein
VVERLERERFGHGWIQCAVRAVPKGIYSSTVSVLVVVLPLWSVECVVSSHSSVTPAPVIVRYFFLVLGNDENLTFVVFVAAFEVPLRFDLKAQRPLFGLLVERAADFEPFGLLVLPLATPNDRD